MKPRKRLIRCRFVWCGRQGKMEQIGTNRNSLKRLTLTIKNSKKQYKITQPRLSKGHFDPIISK
nr:MAG TPA: hypothetical protein [Caudoviricetes sp.]